MLRAMIFCTRSQCQIRARANGRRRCIYRDPLKRQIGGKGCHVLEASQSRCSHYMRVIRSDTASAYAMQQETQRQRKITRDPLRGVDV